MADAWLPERTLRQHSLTDKMPCMEVDELLNRFGLKEFFPEKITLGDIISIDIHPKPLGLKNIPWLMLRDIIKSNYRFRDSFFKSYLRESLNVSLNSSTAETNTIDELLFDSDEHLDVNPLDFLLLILLCCSSSLKQVVAYKLFLCKLSIPLVYPFLDNGKLIVRVWPLQQIIIENKILQKVSVECPCQVISFVRLGRPTISKSKLINELLHEQYHDTFFNRDCPLGTNKRLISEGLIETMWYIPTTNTSKPDDLLELKDVTMFLNLRGDGEDQVQQLDFLSHLSSVIVVVIDISYLNKENDTLFKLPNCKGIVLVIDASQTDRKTTRLLLQTYLKQNSENKHFFRCTVIAVDGVTKSMFFIKNDIIKNLIELLQFQKQKSLRDELQRFDSRYTVDEHHDPYKRYKSIIENIFSSVTAVDFEIKQTLDSIQVDVILNSILEAVNKSRLTRVAHKSRSKFGNIRLRRIQQTVMDKNTYLIFIKEILSAVLFTHFESTDRFRVFLTMTKLYFDDRCRQTLPKLTEKYKSDWQSLKLAERNKTYEAIVILKENLYKSEQLLQNAAFGTENLMRIVGQIYIAIITRPKRRERGLLENLLNSANAFIMSGCPFEIMNGDTTNIPLQWVHAVFKNLHDSVKGESMLVVSVLGVQSSGKSTMLNAMFGLNFAVSAGRCTSGMFMQLVKVKSKQSRYQYVLVIDSEGIRAPERICGGGYTHDNTLATLVMAISDITIINVKGETISEIEDVLQIAVHGFLRLKLVDHERRKRTCIFVHQNVSAIDAKTKLSQGRQKFVELLDIMTKEAAVDENKKDIVSFNQVINFNSDTHVWYLPNLWNGDPPMAHINPNYSESVIRVKNSVLFEHSLAIESFRTLIDIYFDIENLWNKILADDSIFKFRNTLEYITHKSLEKAYEEGIQRLLKGANNFLENTKRYSNHKTTGELEKQIPIISKELSNIMSISLFAANDELNSFIDNHDMKNIMIQWKAEKLIGLQQFCENIILEKMALIKKETNQYTLT